MTRGVPYIMTLAEGTKGFLILMRELMWCANFSYELEYFVYTTKIGPNLVECYASVLLHPHLMTGPPERSHMFSGIRSSTEAAIQAYAYRSTPCFYPNRSFTKNLPTPSRLRRALSYPSFAQPLCTPE